MKYCLLVFFIIFTIKGKSDVKDVLKKVPKRFDTVIKLDLETFFEIDNVQLLIKLLPDIEKSMKEMEKAFGIEFQDIKSLYTCGNLNQFLDEEGNIKGIREIEYLITEGKLEALFFAELSKPVDPKKIKVNPSKKVGTIEIDKVKYFKIENKDFPSSCTVFLNSKLICFSMTKTAREVINLKSSHSLIKNEKLVELLKENGFGGILSIVHAGKIDRVSDKVSWMKEYRGCVFNTWYKKGGIEIELTTNYAATQAVRSAYTMAVLGLSFLESRPDLKIIKNGISLKALDLNLFIDYKMRPDFSKAMRAKFAAAINEEVANLVASLTITKLGKSKRKQRSLAMGLQMYLNENPGKKYPKDLSEIAESIGGEKRFEELMTCPITNKKYIYKMPKGDVVGSAIIPFLFSETEEGTVTGFLDGHVEVIR